METTRAGIAIYKINYLSDFILTVVCDVEWETPFCIKFWTGEPSQAYYVGWTGTEYKNCKVVESDPSKLLVLFDDHHLPVGELKMQIVYHTTIEDFPNAIVDEVTNSMKVMAYIDGKNQKVALDFEGEEAAELQFELPAYANEAQRIANEEQRIANEQARIEAEQQRINNEQTRQNNEAQRIAQETARVNEYAGLKADVIAATTAANDAATLAIQKAQLAADKAALADAAATLANQKAQLAADKAALADAAATIANQKAEYADAQGDYAKEQGDYAKEQGDTALADHRRAESDHETAASDHTIAANDHTQAGNDHTRAESDHSTAADDHTLAASDHSTAAADHTLAASDHSTAAADHTLAASDHSTAANDHTQAGNDHTRAESDHTRAESDHAAVEVYVDSLGAFDISSYHATGGVLAKYADLTAALGTNGVNIPEAIRKGGMSVKFVQSSDNKYIQARCMAQNFTTDITQWQGVDEQPTVGSDNLVKSGGVEQVIGSDFVIEKSDAGETKYPIKVGHTYTITNLLSSSVNISTRETQSGDNHDTTLVPSNSTVVFTPTVDGNWIRTGAACKIQIIDNGSLLARVKKNEADIATIKPVAEPLKFHSSVAKYCVKAEGFKTGLYWYEDNTTHKVVSINNSNTMAGVSSCLDVVAGDKVVFNLSSTTQSIIIILADNSDNVIATYNYGIAVSLNGKLVIPSGCTKLYFNTLQPAVSDSYLIVNGEYMDDFQGQIDDLSNTLWVIQPTEIQIGKGVEASTGNVVGATSQKAVVINLTQVKAKRIKFVLTVSSTYGYGFIVNGTWSGKRYSSFPSGLYYQQLDIEVPQGATEFRFSWSPTHYTEDNPIYCILEDALMQVYEIKSMVVSLENAIFKEKVLDISDSISDGGILLDGTFDTNATFGRVEISLNEDVIYKSFTFKKTYVNNTTRCCYGFVINNQWVGYPGMNGVYDTEEVTVVVPEGATIFRVTWNRHIITDDNYVLKALASSDNADIDANNKPVFQFTPDFVLSRVPQLECPSKATVLALKPAQVYDMYDGLMASYPNYITKVDCDAVAQAALEITAPSYMEGLPIYMYKFTPKIGGNSTGADQTSRFKILITSMHPQEKFGILAMFDMAKMICENWANDVNAEQLRSLVDIYIMPCPWPWNMENGSRVNYNGVNGNRQFPTRKWVESGQGTSDWSGTAPLSEYEAKVINYFLLQIQPHVSLDVHTSGNDNVGHMGIFLMNKFDQPLIDLCGVIARTTSNRVIQDNSNFPQDGDTCMYGVYPEDGRTLGKFYTYAYEQGCKYSILSEESPYSNWANGVFGGTSVSPTEEYNDGILREQVQYIFNTVLRLTKAASIQYYSD